METFHLLIDMEHSVFVSARVRVCLCARGLIDMAWTYFRGGHLSPGRLHHVRGCHLGIHKERGNERAPIDHMLGARFIAVLMSQT